MRRHTRNKNSYKKESRTDKSLSRLASLGFIDKWRLSWFSLEILCNFMSKNFKLYWKF